MAKYKRTNNPRSVALSTIGEAGQQAVASFFNRRVSANRTPRDLIRSGWRVGVDADRCPVDADLDDLADEVTVYLCDASGTPLEHDRIQIQKRMPVEDVALLFPALLPGTQPSAPDASQAPQDAAQAPDGDSGAPDASQAPDGDPDAPRGGPGAGDLPDLADLLGKLGAGSFLPVFNFRGTKERLEIDVSFNLRVRGPKNS